MAAKNRITDNSIYKFWPIFIAILGVAVSWGGLMAWVDEAKNDIEQIEQTYVTQQVLSLELENIEKDVGYNKEALKELKEGQKKILNIIKPPRTHTTRIMQ